MDQRRDVSHLLPLVFTRRWSKNPFIYLFDSFHTFDCPTFYEALGIQKLDRPMVL